MPVLYNRYIELKLSETNTDGIGVSIKPTNNTANGINRVVGPVVSFKVVCDTEKEFNTASITVKGVSEGTFKRIEKYKFVSLIVGYSLGNSSNYGYIFKGDVINMNMTYSNTTSQLTIDAKDGIYTDKVSVLRASYAPDTTAQVVLRDCQKVLKKFGVNTKKMFSRIRKYTKDKIYNKPLKSGYSAHDRALRVVRRIMRLYNYNVYIYNGALILAPKKYKADTSVIKLSKYSGLLSLPVTSTKGDITFTALINHKVKVGKAVQVVDNNKKNLYIVQKIVYNGASNSNKFTMKITGITSE